MYFTIASLSTRDIFLWLYQVSRASQTSSLIASYIYLRPGAMMDKRSSIHQERLLEATSPNPFSGPIWTKAFCAGFIAWSLCRRMEQWRRDQHPLWDWELSWFPNKCERAQDHGLKSVLQSWYFKYRNELLYLRRSKVLAWNRIISGDSIPHTILSENIEDQT